jgi:CheY-like chemotaxis protein
VREELEKANGQLFIDSSLNQGTKIELIIPVAEKPNWITTIINKKNDKVLVLEDNEYNFEELENYLDYNYVQWLKNPSQYSSDHFEEAEFDIICDYDFFNSNINGLDFLEINNFKNAVLFTSYHSDPKVQKRAKELEIKILPKFIITDRVFPVKTKITTDPIFPSTQIRNLYLMEDDEIQGTILKEELEEKGIHCNVFKSYDEFRSEASPSKEDIIISDLHLGEYNNKEGFNYGVNLCKDLNSNGFKKIMLFSNEFDNIENIESVRNECPFVLNFIYKKDEDIIKS